MDIDTDSENNPVDIDSVKKSDSAVARDKRIVEIDE